MLQSLPRSIFNLLKIERGKGFQRGLTPLAEGLGGSASQFKLRVPHIFKASFSLLKLPFYTILFDLAKSIRLLHTVEKIISH